jgi:hypothetical protein
VIELLEIFLLLLFFNHGARTIYSLDEIFAS